MEINLAFLLALFWLLGRAAEAVVSSLARLSIRLRLSHFVTGFFILGMATSLPEFLVGVQAVVDQLPALSLGHLIGGSVVLLSLVVGTNAFLNKEVKVLRSLKKKELLIVNALILAPFLFSLNGALSQYEGLGLMAGFGAYLFFCLNRKNDTPESRPLEEPVVVKMSLRELILGLLLLVIFSRLIVQTAGALISSLHWTPLVFGLLVLSLGTNLPELAVTFKSRSNFRRPFALGNILGSAAANSLVAGLVAFLHPIVIAEPRQLLLSGGFLIAALVFFDWFSISGKTLTRREGAGLVALYLAFILTMTGWGINN